ncbi:hypothetical protein BE20_40665 [Sorangium cellulosum]|nr:hypothetical protein BE20_40665 [Sorangium cellulosum]
MRPCGIVAAFLATNGPRARAESAWTARAQSSLPDPLPPRTSVCSSALAIHASRSRRRQTAGLSPTIPCASGAPKAGAPASEALRSGARCRGRSVQ